MDVLKPGVVKKEKNINHRNDSEQKLEIMSDCLENGLRKSSLITEDFYVKEYQYTKSWITVKIPFTKRCIKQNFRGLIKQETTYRK